MIGRKLAHYEIVDKIGHGGMGLVYRAVDRKLGRRVALKILPPAMASDPERLERFERETRAIAALNHPNIITIYSVEHADGFHFFTMELVDGPTLADILPKQGVDLKRFFELAVPLADALSAAHAQGITHRDLKPANVMVARDGRLKVLDFGIAKLRPGALPYPDSGVFEPIVLPTTLDGPTRVEGSRRSDPAERHPPDEQPTDEQPSFSPQGFHPTAEDLTAFGQVLGTGPYMSPEQILGLPVDPRSDVFSLGTLFYLMLFGDLPFDGTRRTLRNEILEARPIYPLPPERFPPRLRGIFVRCLHNDSEERYADAGELRDALIEVQDNLEQHEMLSNLSRSGTVETLPPALIAELRAVARAERRDRLRQGLRTALLAALLLVVLLGAWSWERELRAQRNLAAVPEVSRPSLAVLFFQNLSADPDLDWMRVGLADMLVTDLTQIADLEVRSTDRLYQVLRQLDKLDTKLYDSETLLAVARETGVRMVVVGSYLRVGETFQVNVKLQDATSGDILVAERREGRGEGSLFAIIDELSYSVRQRLAPSAPSKDRGIGEITTESVDALRCYVGARELHLQNKDEEAIALLEKAVGIDPHFASALVMLSGLYESRANLEQARAYRRLALENADQLPVRQHYFIEGEYYLSQWSTYGRALEAFERAVKIDPFYEPSRSNLALLYGSLERYEDTLAQLDALRDRGNDFAPHYYLLATTYSVLDRFERGEQILQGYLRRFPESWYAHLSHGWHLAHWGRFEEAEQAFGRAEELRPGAFFIRNGQWRLAILRDDWQGAEEAARAMAAMTEQYEHWRGLVSQARNRLYAGRGDAAVELYIASTKVYPEPGAFRALSHCFAAETLLALGENGRALEHAELAEREGIDEWPERRGLFLEGLVRLERGEKYEIERLMRRLETLAAIQPNVVETRQLAHLRGLVELSQGHLGDARKELETALALLPPRGIPWHWHTLPDHLPLWSAMAELELADGHPDKAAEWLERIVESGVEHIEFPILYLEAHHRLADLLDASGNAADADRAAALRARVKALWGRETLRP